MRELCDIRLTAWFSGRKCNTVAPTPFRFVERVIRAPEEILGGLVVPALGDAEARGDSGSWIWSFVRTSERTPQPVRQGDGTSRCRVGSDDRELVAAKPSRDVGIAEVLANEICRPPKDVVAALMSVFVINDLEIVEIDE